LSPVVVERFENKNIPLVDFPQLYLLQKELDQKVNSRGA
jgi:hypothetical protein